MRADPSVERYLARLRRRAALVHGVRAAVAALGAAGIVFALGALALGPLGEPALAIVAWGLCAGAAVGVGAWAWRAFRPLRGAGAARLLGEIAPELSSAARSAYELARAETDDDVSRAMVRAHEARVRAVLARIPPRTVVRWRGLRHRAVALGAVGLLVAGLLLATERGSAGAYALVHPGERNEGGDRVAVAFSDVEAHLVFPSYLERAATTVMDPVLLEVPRGTAIELRAKARLDAARAALRVGARSVSMEGDGRGRWVARFVAREDGPLVLRLRREGGEWVHDAIERTVRALPDEAPRVDVIDPSEDLVLDRPEPIEVGWDATDDVGVAHVDLVVRTSAGVETRRRIASYERTEQPALASGAATLDPARLEAQPGDTLTFWVEARDGDIVSGPNIGRSSERHVTIASESTRREARLAELAAVLDRAIALLADRLEQPVPGDTDAARRRFDGLEGSTEPFIEALDAEAERLRSGEGRAADVGVYREMAARVRRLLREERLAHSRVVAPVEQRRNIDGRASEELESDVLALDDLLSRARVEDAAAIARELEALRREIHSLLSELTRTDSAEARERLLAAIGRAQARMRELMERIGEMGTSVPSEFMNAGEMPAQESADTLASLREAVQRGNLELADRLIGELSRQIDQLARALGQTEQSFVESRFGPRERAFAEALDALGGLEAEQGQLARRATERRSNAAQRALDAMGGRDSRVTRRLADQARAARDALETIDRDGLAGFEQDTYDRARQRLVDTQDALRTGDLGEARRMAEAAAEDLSGLSRDLDLSALMFPGHEGETSNEARRARQADRQLRDLRRALDEALPDVGAHLQPADRAAMREDRARQRAAHDATERLADRFEEGPDQAPLDENAGRELRAASDEMRSAGEALERGDPLESARRQEEAARRLTELRERLEQDSQGGGGGGGESGAEAADHRPVDIPDADQFEGPMEMRRRLLDAMREAAPRGYEDAVRRYYEGLLR